MRRWAVGKKGELRLDAAAKAGLPLSSLTHKPGQTAGIPVVLQHALPETRRRVLRCAVSSRPRDCVKILLIGSHGCLGSLAAVCVSCQWRGRHTQAHTGTRGRRRCALSPDITTVTRHRTRLPMAGRGLVIVSWRLWVRCWH